MNGFVFDKPSGLLSVPGIGPRKRIAWSLEPKWNTPGRGSSTVSTVTSGVIVLARDAEAHRQLSVAFQERHTSKRYLALVSKVPEPLLGSSTFPCGKTCAALPGK